MKMIHRKIDFAADRDYIMEAHCRINYECDCPWARKLTYQEYRDDWFSMKNQMNGFYDYLQQTAKVPGTVAEIIEDEDGRRVGYLWAPFQADEESGFIFAEIQDIYIEEEFRRRGCAEALYRYAEENARKHGARVIRAGTGCENNSSIRLHEKLGYYAYRFEFEKEL